MKIQQRLQQQAHNPMPLQTTHTHNQQTIESTNPDQPTKTTQNQITKPTKT